MKPMKPTFLAPCPQARAEVEAQVRRVVVAFAEFERDRDGVLAGLGALEAELAAPRAAALDPLPALDPGPDEVRQSSSRRAWLTCCSAYTIETRAASAGYNTRRGNWQDKSRAAEAALAMHCHGRRAGSARKDCRHRCEQPLGDVQLCVVTLDNFDAGNTHEQGWAGGRVHGGRGRIRGDGGG